MNPSGTRSLVRCDIDFDRDGKQAGFLAVPVSTNESAYGTLPIPITVVKNGPGPTFSFTGGVHGDEYEGPIALMKLSRILEPRHVRGRVIIIPALNLPALLAGQRCSPMDGLNLNRTFPGKADGSVTDMIAHYFSSEIVPRSDYHLDMHSGGKTLEYIPSIFVPPAHGDSSPAQIRRAAEEFGIDMVILEDDDFPDSGRFLTAMFTQAGKPGFCTELAGGGRVTPAVVSMAEHGIQSLLVNTGIVESSLLPPDPGVRRDSRTVCVEDRQCYIMAPDDGLYEPLAELGDPVETGQVIGQVHFPQHADKPAVPVSAGRSGLLLCRRIPGMTFRGDNVAIIAQSA